MLQNSIKESLVHETEIINSLDYYSSKTLSVAQYEDVELRPKIGLTRGTTLLDNSLKHLTINMSQYKVENNVKDYCDEDVVYLGRFITRWGHCITTNLMSMWIFLDECNNTELKSMPMVYVIDNPKTRLPDSFFELLRMLGVNIGNLKQINSDTHFRRVFIPEPCYYFDDELNGQQRYTEEYVRIINRITEKVLPNPEYDKIYLTRSKFTLNHRDYGEEQIERVFRKLGYAVISPESLSVQEQISIIKGCKFFASTDGSIGHNSIFLPEGAECVFIRKVDFVNPYQALINHAKKLNTTIIDANLSFLLYNKKEPWEGPFFVFNNKRLREWSGVRTFFPLFSFMQYIGHYTPRWLKSKYKNVMSRN